MFRWGIIFLVIALIAAALGFGGLAGTAAGAAKIVFVVGIILFLVSLFMPKTTLDFRPLRKFYPKPVQRTGFCGFSE
ncbi:hypothetical protein ECAZ01_02546 [Escherichia coli]|nr:hypothetical protein ECAZ01_02546 [Escherichia coli]